MVTKMNLIVAVDNQWGIGCKGSLLVRIPNDHKAFRAEDIYIIGGESVYRMMLPYCQVAHVTKIDHVYEADAYFPNLDKSAEWEITADSEEQTYFDIAYSFVKYERTENIKGE